MEKRTDSQDGKGSGLAGRQVRRRRKRIGKQILAMIVCLVAMVAVMYTTVSIYAWIRDRDKEEPGDDIVPAFGEGGETEVVSAVSIDENGNVVDAEGNIVGVLSNSVVYSQEDLEQQVASARQEAATEVLENIKTGLNDGDSILETLRPLYPDDLIVYSGGQYNVVPIDHNLKQHQLDEANLNILESGEYQYLQDGQVISHKGIDVSRHQGDIDWNLVAQDGVEFAFIRVGNRGYSTGKMVEDEYFNDNITEALQAGIKVGVYYYSQAVNETEVLEEANFVLEKIAPYKVECPVVFDVEKVSGDGRMNNISVEERTALTKLFCQTIQNAGYRPMIYHNTEMGVMLLNLEELEEYDKWFAAYSDVFYYPYDYQIWQYSQSGKVQGITSDVDLNISFAPVWQE